MMVMRDNETGIGSESAIHKLVVIGVLRNKPKFELWIYKLYVIAVHQSIDNMFSHGRVCLDRNYLLIFSQNLI